MLKQLVKSLHYHRKIFLTRQRILHNTWFKISRNASTGQQDLDNDDINKPLPYSTSEASNWPAVKSRNPSVDRHPQENNVISISLAIFLIYFLVLREENDIDLILSREFNFDFNELKNSTVSLSSNK